MNYSDFRRRSQCSEGIVLKFWGAAAAIISVRQRFTSMEWSLRYSDNYFEHENECLRLLHSGEMRITNVERKEIEQ
jgi:hypothetical protein